MRPAPLYAALLAATALMAAERATIPPFALPDSCGLKRSATDYPGSVVVLNFWATWCRACRAEVSWLDDLQRDYSERAVVVLGVATDERGWPAVTPFLAERKLSYPVLLGNPRLARLYGGLETLPVTVFLDRCGRLAARHEGVLTPRQMRKITDLLLAEASTCSPAAAQNAPVSQIE